MSEHTVTSESGSIAIDRPHRPPTATWTIDPADSSITLTWRKLRLWTVTRRLRCRGVVHVDDPPPVGVIRFQQPSGLPVLTMALDPASIQTHNADLDTSLRVMTTLTANGTAGSVELRLEVDPAASPDWLVLKGHGQLDRRAFGIGSPVSTFSPQMRLDLAVRARRVGEPTSALRVQGVPEKPTARDRSGGIQLTNLPAEVAAQVPMHRVAARTGTHPTAVGTTAEPQLPIGRYRRVPVTVHQADPDAPEVARRLIALIATRWPATPAEHVGSTAVPGLAGKGIIDLLLAAEPAHIPAITQALLELGFQPQIPAAFPPTRPMLWGTFRHGASEYRVHVHVVPAASPEVAALRGFRDALRGDPVLRRRYAALKRAIVAGGPADPVAFTKAKHDWIAATLTWLGLADDQRRRLYQDDPNQDRSWRVAS
jgi:GrpB-like predicted nucleotidyltransferase (UPF0157 family)/polyisoprenoid-binding protein YceI